MTPSRPAARRLLLVYPKFPPGHLVGYEYMVPLYPGRRAVMPPLGLLTFAGCVPPEWSVRLIDGNVTPLRQQDIDWADVVMFSAMHPQRHGVERLIDWANRSGKLTVLGGPSVSICPEYYPAADILHVGELGDATDQLIERLATTVEKPAEQIVFRTEQKVPLDEHPLPAIDLVDVRRYLVMPLQFSVGCPYQCDFCDIPIIYGRKPRVKSPARVLSELQALYDAGFVGALLFVDDNLMANRGALRELLPEVVAWQQRRGYPFALTAEVSVDLAGEPEILQQLHDARFTHLFFGVESVDNDVLCSISKGHNTRRPMVEALQTVQSYGIEVLMGMIVGFDGDDETTARRIGQLVEQTHTTLVYFNLLAALPKTPLWERMEAEGRLIAADGDPARSDELLTCTTTNIRCRMGNDKVEGLLLEAIREVYDPENVYRRITWNAANVYGKQLRGMPPSDTWSQRAYLIRYTIGALARMVWQIGIRSPDRRHFWRFVADCRRLRREGKIASMLETLVRDAPHAHHLIEWGRNALRDHALVEIDESAPTQLAAG